MFWETSHPPERESKSECFSPLCAYHGDQCPFLPHYVTSLPFTNEQSFTDSTFNFSVPFLSWLAIISLSVATVVLYLVPLRYLIMLWGINKFTKKLRSPNAINNNELLDFLSRVPDIDEKVNYDITANHCVHSRSKLEFDIG